MDSKKNILISQIHMEVGGIETVLLNLLNSLDKEKYNIDLMLYYPKGDFLEKIPDWINVIPIWNETRHQNFWKNIVLSRNFIKRILKNIFLSKFTVKHFIPKKEYDIIKNALQDIAGWYHAGINIETFEEKEVDKERKTLGFKKND